MQIDCIDERPGADSRLAAQLTVFALTIAAAGLIRARVELEAERLVSVHEHLIASEAAHEASERARLADWLVRPDVVEILLNGDRGPYGPGTGDLALARRNRDWRPDVEAMVAAALKGFEKGSFYLFAGDRQIVALDEQIDLRRTHEVVFLRLVPLQGG